VGEAAKPFTEAIRDKAESRITGFGLDDGVQMGPVISQESRARIESLIGKAVGDGAKLVVDAMRKSRIMKRALSSGLRFSKTSLFRAKWRELKSSDQCCRFTI
jgi:acyl-CoA reductase-like NAD-dependent aldehyde dehydrogenase